MSPIRPMIEALELSGIGKVAFGAMEDPEVVPLWFGESDLPTPDFVREAAKAALDEGKTFYGSTRGHPPLRAALKAYLDRIYGTDLDPERISAPGSTMLAVQIACQSLIEPGDEMVLVSPYWPNIRSVVELLGGRTVDVRLREGPGRWHLDLEDLRGALTNRTKAIYLNSPSNPTGWVMTRAEQAEVLKLCREHGLALVADEVYHRNVFDGPNPAPSFLTQASDDEPVFVLNGFSKAWAMTGWRMGWMVHPRGMAMPVTVLSEVSNTGPTAFAQYGGIAALNEGEGFIREYGERCRTNRDLVMEILGEHPRIRLLRPEGAFYAFAKVEGCDDSLGLARRVLAEAKVGTAAGYTFGEGNEGHLRLCFAISAARLEPALRKVAAVLDGL